MATNLSSFHSWAKLDEIEKIKKTKALKARTEGLGQRRRPGRLSILRVIGVRQSIEEEEDIQDAEDAGAVNEEVGLDPLLPSTTPNPIFSTSPVRTQQFPLNC